MRKENNKLVYRHRRLDTNEIFYIGMGDLKRAYYNNPNKRNKIWVRITNKTNYEVEILQENLDWDTACELEEFLISLYGRIDNKTGTLANLTNGGDGSKGCSPSKETRKKISNFHKNKIVSDESKEKMSLAKKDKYFLSDNPNAKKVINIETGEIFNSAKEAALSINKIYGSFTWACKHTKNFNFRYL